MAMRIIALNRGNPLGLNFTTCALYVDLFYKDKSEAGTIYVQL